MEFPNSGCAPPGWKRTASKSQVRDGLTTIGAVGEDSGFEPGPTDPRPEAVDVGLQRIRWLVLAVLPAHTGTWFAA
jgi:hypothetical protein